LLAVVAGILAAELPGRAGDMNIKAAKWMRNVHDEAPHRNWARIDIMGQLQVDEA